jgi:hypothetical protein
MEEKKAKTEDEGKLPLDARLLSEAVIEFNISRRNVGLYPPGHAVITGSIQKAYELLQKLFELRTSITLGIAKDALVIDEYSLDRKNPVYREVALSFHESGIAGITFHAGLTREELTGLHELMTRDDAPEGKELAELAAQGGLSHLRLSPIDYSSFRFVEDGVRDAGTGEVDIWEDYVYGLLKGTLTAEETGDVLRKIPPERVAEIIDRAGEDADDESYDRVITSYLRNKDGSKRLSSESLEKLVSLTNNLSPELKRQFLTRTFKHAQMDTAELEQTLGDMTSESFRKTAELFSENSAVIPDTIKNLLDKLSSVKAVKSFGFDAVLKSGPVVHDIEIGEEIAGLFDEDHFNEFVSDGYRKDLDSMLNRSKAVVGEKIEQLRTECTDAVIDSVAAEVMIEALDADLLDTPQYLGILTRLTELANEFVDTGRFEDALNVYVSIYSQSLSGKFRHEAGSTLLYFFQSGAFLDRVVEALRTWGRKDREGVLRLARALKAHLASPLLDALEAEDDPTERKFLLFVLSSLGSDIIPEVLRKLASGRWYTVRNMLYLVRACGSDAHVEAVRKFIKHRDPRVCMEALNALLRFRTQDSIPYLKFYLQSKDDSLRNGAVALSGIHRAKEAVPLLIGLLEKKDALGAGFHAKAPVVKALGEIGDPRAVPVLTDIVNAKALLRKGYLDELRAEIFRNLKNYPPASLKPLLEAGIASENEEIRSAGERLLKKFFPAGGGSSGV